MNRALIENAGKIIAQSFQFLPAYLKLQNVVITQQDWVMYIHYMAFLNSSVIIEIVFHQINPPKHHLG